ncbi:MAG TPA: glycosyltransferase, partial [Desulfitobacteriaceae bacterium]|nr:glycosyltransferase [Desulfitobacteriaceae bacterium]
KYFKIMNIADRYVYTKGPIAIFEKNNFDLAHAIYDGKTALRAGDLAHNAELPFLLSFHGGFDTNAKIFDPRYTERTREIAEKANAVTVICSADKYRLRKIGIQRPVEIVPVPIDFSLIPNANGNSSFNIVAVGRLIPKKGIDVALKALKFLPKEYFLTVVGDGELRNALKALSESLGVENRVTWKGLLPLNKTLEVMSSSSVLLHPARVASDGNAEGTPQTILWAQAMGLPVITTPTGSICEIVINNMTGLLVEEENPEALANAILLFNGKSDLREDITREAKAKIHKDHSLNRVVEKYFNIYKRIALGSST